MAISEFELIQRYFQCPVDRESGVCLGIGDDAAVLQVLAGQELVVTMDTLVAGVHFPLDTDPADVGYKSLAVNLSDLAAMGAAPRWVCLALTLPEADEAWIQAFAQGFFALAQTHGVALVGGDTTRGPLSITVTAHGLVPCGQAIRRDGARPGDVIMVTGTLGDAALALRRGDDASDALRARLNRPTPRVAAGILLREWASSAIDISDGLLADLTHITHASRVGAELQLSLLPRSPALLQALESMTEADAGLSCLLAGGDDYELCFTVTSEQCAAAASLLLENGITVTTIGRIIPGQGVVCYDAHGKPCTPDQSGYEHFT